MAVVSLVLVELLTVEQHLIDYPTLRRVTFLITHKDRQLTHRLPLYHIITYETNHPIPLFSSMIFFTSLQLFYFFWMNFIQLQ